MWKKSLKKNERSNNLSTVFNQITKQRKSWRLNAPTLPVIPVIPSMMCEGFITVREKRNTPPPTQFKNTTIQRENRKFFTTEMLSILLILYSQQIETGEKSLSQFGHMTTGMLARELVARRLVIESRINAKKENQRARQVENEAKILELLKQQQKQ
jgi:ABC-type dipeptide/oligopeptide/nickel transport system ATPase component